ncbi:MAG TPA: pitrilysin family protein [Ktedonobacterales bacterium]
MSTEAPAVGMSGASAPHNYFYHAFPSGLQVVGQRMPSLSSITFGVQFGAGTKDEPTERYGLAHLMESMMFQGTKSRTVRQLTEAFETLGARKGGSASTETSTFWCQLVARQLDPALDLIADLLLEPTFPTDEFEQMRQVALQTIRRREDEPMSRLSDLLLEQFYLGSNLGHRMIGTRESMEALTPEDLRAFWSRLYRPGNALFAIAGNFDWDHLIQRLDTLFGGWLGKGEPVASERPKLGSRVVIQHYDGQQEHIGLAAPNVTFGDPDYYAAQLTSEIFGGGMTSRLFAEVREKRGLVYAVSSRFGASSVTGRFHLYAGTTPEKAHETMRVMIEEMRKLEAEGVTDDELRRAKVQLKSELVMHAETSSARMGAIAHSWWFEHRLKTIQEVREAIDAVTREQIVGLLKRFPLTDPLVVTAIGPCSREQLTENLGIKG